MRVFISAAGGGRRSTGRREWRAFLSNPQKDRSHNRTRDRVQPDVVAEENREAGEDAREDRGRAAPAFPRVPEQRDGRDLEKRTVVFDRRPRAHRDAEERERDGVEDDDAEEPERDAEE